MKKLFSCIAIEGEQIILQKNEKLALGIFSQVSIFHWDLVVTSHFPKNFKLESTRKSIWSYDVSIDSLAQWFSTWGSREDFQGHLDGSW